MIYVFLATGFEDIEAIAPVDIMRRAGLEVQTVSITGEEIVTSAHGVGIASDLLLSDVDFSSAEMLVLPGGLPGSTNLDACKPLTEAIKRHFESGGPIAAICAAPLVLGGLGLLRGKSATCYPGFEGTLEGANYTGELFTVDGNITTGEGPAAAFPFAYCLLEQLTDAQTAHDVAEGMRFVHLMSN